jgi:predicted naringenin-chalcone synthase
MTAVYINRISTAVPEHDIHGIFVTFAGRMLQDERVRSIFMRMAGKAEIAHRYSSLSTSETPGEKDVSVFSLYGSGSFPSTARRMQIFEAAAPLLARRALDQLALSSQERRKIRHVIVICCTGFYAPGLDFEIIDHLGLAPDVERTMVGFMGCYAAINGLKLARHIVRSQPADSVLVVNLELCTLHLQETQSLNEVLSFLVFGDGCAASLISNEMAGVEIDSFRAMQIPKTRELITWRIGDIGFDMLLSGQVPGAINKSMREHAAEFSDSGPVDLWAVHPGGRSILDAVQQGLDLPLEALCSSRAVLSRYGNMSSATVMFVLQELMRSAQPGQNGCAISFGPGLTAETMRFHAV